MTAIEKKFTLHVPSSTQNLAMIREFVGNIGSQAGLDDKDISRLELAVDEACANVIEHAYEHDSSKEVVVRATFDAEELRIDVEDTGRNFNPEQVGQQDLDQLIAERKSGGLGMRLMKKFMDEVRYEIGPGSRNELHMTKRIRQKS